MKLWNFTPPGRQNKTITRGKKSDWLVASLQRHARPEAVEQGPGGEVQRGRPCKSAVDTFREREQHAGPTAAYFLIRSR